MIHERAPSHKPTYNPLCALVGCAPTSLLILNSLPKSIMLRHAILLVDDHKMPPGHYKKLSMLLNTSFVSSCWCGLRGSFDAVRTCPSFRKGNQLSPGGISFDCRLPGVSRSPAPRMLKGVATNSVARGENKDGVLGTSFIARSMIVEDCGKVIPGNIRGL